MINDLNDFYAYLRGVRERLVASDGYEWARRLHDAELAGTTSSEILEDVWFVLKELEADPASDRLMLRPGISDALKYIDRTLGPSKSP